MAPGSMQFNFRSLIPFSTVFGRSETDTVRMVFSPGLRLRRL